MTYAKMIACLSTLFLLSCPLPADARDSPHTRHGTGPKYWIAYEECFVTNVPLSEGRWKANIDWMASTMKPYGYDLICNDGWIEAAQTINTNGYITKYNSEWSHGFAYWAQYLRDKGMKMGVYYNPMWMTEEAYKQNLPVGNTGRATRDIAGYKSFNGALRWVDVDKPGAKEWIQGYVRYFKEMGVTYLRIDFLENYETNYGTRRYDQALSWIAEAAGDDLFISLVMPHCYNHVRTELPYGDMIRISDDCFEGDWAFVSDRRRGEQKDRWPQFGNAFDGFIGFADVGARGQMILDGDFMRMNRLASDHERRFLFSLMVMGGSALAIADQYDTIGAHAWIYQNHEMNELNDLGFAAKPLSYNRHDAVNSSRWIGQLPDGDWIVGLFNRESSPQTRSIDFRKELGIDSGRTTNVRDLWQHKDLGALEGSYSVVLEPHECKVIRIKQPAQKLEAETASLRRGTHLQYEAFNR